MFGPGPVQQKFQDTVGATGALARFVAGVVAVGSTPVVIGATVVAVAALAVYYASQNYNDRESTFTEEMGGEKPATADFEAVRSQMSRLDPDFSKQFDWNGFDSWEDYFWIQSRLLDQQRSYIAQCIDEGTYDDDLYNETVAAVKAADEAADAAAQENANAEDSIPGTWSGVGNGPEDDPECRELSRNVENSKAKVSELGGRCRITDAASVLESKRVAWLEQAQARAVRDQKCWSGGDEGHQQAQAAAWTNVGRCERYLVGDFSR